MEGSKAVLKEEVVREFPPVGKYRIRLLHNPRKPAHRILDIREYVTTEAFEGFTRRGIRISSPAEADLLKDVLKEVLEANGLALAEGKK